MYESELMRQLLLAKRSFAEVRSQAELGNEDKSHLKGEIMQNIKRKGVDYHGTVQYVRAVSSEKAYHIDLTFEEAIKFSLHVQSCVVALNSIDRKQKPGRDMGMKLALLKKGNTISVQTRLIYSDKRNEIKRMNEIRRMKEAEPVRIRKL